MFNIFECSLKRRTGFSLIRLSDGEGYIFCNDSEFFTHLDALNRERHWWGAELAEDLRSDLLLHLRKAVSAADVVGIPSVYRFVRDVSPTQNRNLLSKVYLRGLCAVLHGAGDLCRENVLFTEEKCNECLFKEPEQVMRLAKHARQTFLVTSLKPKAINAIFGEAHPYLHIPVSTHARHCINDDYLGSESPIVLSHAKVSETLRRAIHPGDLVLVGAGLVGKLFVHEAKQCGAVAIDIGSSFDRWLWTASKTRLTAAFL